MDSTKHDVNRIQTKKCIDKYKSMLDLSILPDDLSISTMTIICKFNSNFNINNIGRYLVLSEDNILSISYVDIKNNKPEKCIRTLIPCKKKRKCNRKNKTTRKTFYNQTTIQIRPEKDKNPLNIKIFKNGSIHMTGCKSIDDCINSINNLCLELVKVKAVIDINNTGKVLRKPFTDCIENISINKIYDLKICMINSGFKTEFNINRERLYHIVNNEGIECKFDLDNHACVDIKYNYRDKKTVSIFVFEKGSVIITGANNSSHILAAYNFIMKKLYENYNDIVSIENMITHKNILKYLDT